MNNDEGVDYFDELEKWVQERAISMDYKVIRKELCRYQLDQFRTNL